MQPLPAPAECIVIDEIGTEAECLAARTIAQRGVQLVATAHGARFALQGWAGQRATLLCCKSGRGWRWARPRPQPNLQCMAQHARGARLPPTPGTHPPHTLTVHPTPTDQTFTFSPLAGLPQPAGNELENVMKNPSLADLVGGIASVTLGDDEAKRRGVQKSVLERQVRLGVCGGRMGGRGCGAMRVGLVGRRRWVWAASGREQAQRAGAPRAGGAADAAGLQQARARTAPPATRRVLPHLTRAWRCAVAGSGWCTWMWGGPWTACCWARRQASPWGGCGGLSARVCAAWVW